MKIVFRLLVACLFFFSYGFGNDYLVRTTLEKMSLEEKIGQLFMVPACPLRENNHYVQLDDLIQKYHIGGVIVKASDPLTQVAMLNHLQKKSSLPLLVSMDAEWGLAMRMIDTIAFPKNLTLGAIGDNKWIFDVGNVIGRQCKDVGAHINLAPVVDVNVNPHNPIIHMRSFGQDPKNVADKGIAYIRGLQEANMIACAKHFPGHGEPSVDSHKGLPTVRHTKSDLEKIDLYPFLEAVKSHVGAIMVGHLVVPALDPSRAPASLSRKMVHDLLRTEWGYEGLIITDALNMKALTNNYSVEEIAVKALHAGNDILLYGDHIAPNVGKIITEDVPKAFAAIKEAVLQKRISEDELNQHVLRILQCKDTIDLLRKRPIAIDDTHLMDKLHSSYAYRLKKNLYREALTVIKNDHQLLPLNKTQKYFYLRFGDVKKDEFFLHLQKILNIQRASVQKLLMNKHASQIIVVSIFDVIPQKKDYNIQMQWLEDIQELMKNNTVIIALFGTPYAAKFFEKPSSVLVAYEDDPDAQIAAAEIIANIKRPKGMLPVSASKKYPIGTSITW